MKDKDNFQKFEEWVLNYFILDSHDPLNHKFWTIHSIIIRFITKIFVIGFVVWVGIITLMACIGGNYASQHINSEYINGTITEQSYMAFKNIAEPAMFASVNLSQYIIVAAVLLYLCIIIYPLIRWKYRKKGEL